MENLKLPARTKWHYDAIVHSKSANIQLALAPIETFINSRYSLYTRLARANQLIAIPDSTIPDALHQHLISLYNSSIKALQQLKKNIGDAQKPYLKHTCPYCTFTPHNGFDHYLPKEDFPEFAVLSVNLLPCCSKCNSYKGVQWKNAEPERLFLHLYYDAIPTYQYLFAQVQYKKGVPVASFKLAFPEHDQTNLPAIISAHYEKLHLLQRFSEQSAKEISEAITRLTSMKGLCPNAAGIQNYLQREARSLQNNYGINYWKAALIEALAQSGDFPGSL